jgi:hypothetical protein
LVLISVRRSSTGTGGHWQEDSGNWGVFFDDSNAVFPFTKVMKQFENGLEGGASILSFFDLVGLVIFGSM